MFTIKSPSFEQLVKSVNSRFGFETLENYKSHVLLKSPEFSFLLFLGQLKDDYLLMKWGLNNTLSAFTMIKRDELKQDELENRSLEELFFGRKNLDRAYNFGGDLKSNLAQIIRSHVELFNRLKMSIRSVTTEGEWLEFQILLSVRTVEDILYTLGSSEAWSEFNEKQ